MRCINHGDEEACAVCAYCGKALCRKCLRLTETNRLVCSDICGRRLSGTEQVLDLLVGKSLESHGILAYLMFSGGMLFLLLGVGEALVLPGANLFWAGFFLLLGAVLVLFSRRFSALAELDETPSYPAEGQPSPAADREGEAPSGQAETAASETPPAKSDAGKKKAKEEK